MLSRLTPGTTIIAPVYLVGGVPSWLAASAGDAGPPVLVLPLERLHSPLVHLYRFQAIDVMGEADHA